jgi:hypothetical protein
MMATICKSLDEDCGSAEKPKVDIFTPAETIGGSFEGVQYPLDYPVFFHEDFRRFQDVLLFWILKNFRMDWNCSDHYIQTSVLYAQRL